MPEASKPSVSSSKLAEKFRNGTRRRAAEKPSVSLEPEVRKCLEEIQAYLGHGTSLKNAANWGIAELHSRMTKAAELPIRTVSSG